MTLPRIGVVTGSTRPTRRSHKVGAWVCERAEARDDLRPVLLDIADYRLPLLDEPDPPAMGTREQPHTHVWAEAVGACDAYAFVVPEYNRSLPGALKNALDFLFAEWRDKPAGAVGYGVQGGTRAVEHLRLVAVELGMAPVRTSVALDLASDFDDDRPTPGEQQERQLDQLLDELVRWADALRPLREPQSR